VLVFVDGVQPLVKDFFGFPLAGGDGLPDPPAVYAVGLFLKNFLYRKTFDFFSIFAII
jgi:hypothetical protein